MKKTLFCVLGTFVIILFAVSCRNEKSMQELIQEEKKAIDRYIVRNDLHILSEYPKDNIWGEKDYYKTADGVYYHVVDTGGSEKAQKFKLYETSGTLVCLRVESVHYFAVSDTSVFSMYTEYPYTFTYGLQTTYSCAAWAEPLDHVGVNAVVDMIVPSESGMSSDRSSFSPVFFKGVRYTNFK
jgi:hypothetical protein